MRTLRASTMAMLLLLVSISPVALANDSTIAVSTVWSENKTLTGNVTVAEGATLTIETGVTVDAGTFGILVEGTLVANGVTFLSTETPLTQGSHGQGLWQGLTVTSTGLLNLSNSVVANASAALTVEGQLNASNITVNDAYRGVSVNGGHADMADVTFHRIDYEALYLASGTTAVDGMAAHNVAIGVDAWVDTIITNTTVEEAGVGLRAQQGELTVSDVSMTNVSVGLAAGAGAGLNVSTVDAQGVALMVDASAADGLSLNDATVTGERLMAGQGAQAVTLHNVTFTGMNVDGRFAVDLGCAGTCAYNNVHLTNVTNGMMLSGAGTHASSRLAVDAADVGIDVSGLGHVDFSNISVTASETALSVSTPTGAFGTVHATLGSSDAVGVDVLGGAFTFDEVTVEKPFVANDIDSVGLHGWYATLDITTYVARNVSTGVLLEDSQWTGTDLELNVGHDAGLHLVDSDLRADALVTVAQAVGALTDGRSSLHLNTWRASLHDTPLSVGEGGEVIVRTFTPQNTAAGSADAVGDGTLHYGSLTNPTVATATANRFVETSVTFTDLTGNPVEADVSVHGFTLSSNANGAVTLPLLESGSIVDATLSGSGVRTTMYGGQTGQSVQIPVIPTGDWTVASGQTVVLGPRPDGQHHTVNGDLTVANNGDLSLRDTTLIVAPGGSVTLEGTGQIVGSNAVLVAPLVQSSGLGLVTGDSSDPNGLTVEGDVAWACQSARNAVRLTVDGNLTVQPGCNIDIAEGDVLGSVEVRTGGQFTTRSTLHVRVLDKGEPVEGVLIGVDGATGTTDADGSLTTTGLARTVTDSASSYAGLKTVTMQRGSTTDFVMWDTNRSLNHVFMSSTVPSGAMNQWLVLERQWSPYTLDADMTVGPLGTVTIQDGVSLRTAEGVTITVNGVFDAGAATLSSTGSGARWGGLVSGPSAGSVIDLSGTSLVEAAPAITVGGAGEVTADRVMLARSGNDALVTVQSASTTTVTLRNIAFQDSGDGCLNVYPSTGTVTLSNATFSSCYGPAVWAQQAPLAFTNLTFNDGVDEGLVLTGVSGTVAGVRAEAFNGSGAIVVLESMSVGFTLSDVEGNVTGIGGLVGNTNRGLDLQRIRLTGAPAIDLDASSGLLSDITLTGSGSGTGFVSHHGRSSASLVVDGLSVSNYAVGMSLHVDETEVSAPLIVRNAHLQSTTALASDGFPSRFEASTLVGTVELYGTTMEVVDSLVGTVQATEGSVMTAVRTFTLDALRGGVPVDAEFTVSMEGTALGGLIVQGATVEAPVPYRTVTSEGETLFTNLSVVARADGSPPASITLTSPATDDPYIALNLVVNGAPTVTMREPYSGQRVMEGDSIRAVAQASDDLDDASNLTFAWSVTDAQGRTVLTAGNEPVFNITDLPAGYYVVEVQVTDRFGASSTSARDFEYTLLDTDGDWTSTCSSDTWFDPETGMSCGPNIYDEDDDNDGFSDSRDAFPLDPCAQKDTDGDTQPDVLDCPDGITSWLTEDQDDDGDGVPDGTEGVSGDGASNDVNALMVVLVLIIVAIGLFFMRLRGGAGGAPLTLDERHL